MSELSLESLLWVLPGICFFFANNRLRDVETSDVAGWRYVFVVVFIGTITVLPIRYISGEKPTDPLSLKVLFWSSLIAFAVPFITKWIFIPFVNKLEREPNFFIPSTLWSILYFFFPIENRDKFIKSCIEYEGEAVLVTVEEPILYVKNDKSLNRQSTNDNEQSNKYEEMINIQSRVFLGILIEFPYVATDSINSQVIRILPLLSGYNYYLEKTEKEKIKWTKKYDINNESEGIIIPRQKIIHFCLYDKNLHEKMISNQ